jgi:Fic family protein
MTFDKFKGEQMSTKIYNVLQAQLARNKRYIRELEESIQFHRDFKNYADEHNFQSDEYTAHNHLKLLRKELKTMVEVQRTIKTLMKDIVYVGKVH